MTDACAYPIGAFVVVDRLSLGPLVSRLRAVGRLKSGVNVTTFDVRALRRREPALSVANASISLLRTITVDVMELEEDDACALSSSSSMPSQGPSCASVHQISLCPPSDGPYAAADAFLAALETPTTSLPSPPATTATYMAVHTTGHWSEAELLAIMSTSTEHSAAACTAKTRSEEATGDAVAATTTPPIAYVHQLRCYSRACCPIASLPPSLAALRETARRLRSSRTTDNHHDTHARTFSFAELFGGIGMFRLGLTRAGATPVFAVEFAAPACAVYAANFEAESAATHEAVPLVGDITEIPDSFFPPHDILTAGFPCQSFSKAGPASGLHDAKGWLFHEVVRVVRATRPRAFLLENVENLLDVQEGTQLAVIRQWLQYPWTGGSSGNDSHEDATYCVHHEVVDGAAVTPQKRRRVYFVGIRRDLLSEQATATHACDARSDAAHSACVESGDIACCELETRWLQPVFTQVRASLRAMREASQAINTASTWYRPEARYGRVWDVLDSRLPPRVVLPQTMDALFASLRLSPIQWEAVQRSKKYRAHPDWRLADLAGNARTLMGSYRTSFQLYSEFVPLTCAAAPATGGEDEARREAGSEVPCRFYSVRECARLQGIPESFTFLHDEPQHAAESGDSGTARADGAAAANYESARPTRRLPVGAAYKLVGNAVNPLVIECFGHALIQLLHHLDKCAQPSRGTNN